MINQIKIAQIIPTTQAEGPGNRFAIWVQGCPILCKECCNPEMLSDKGGEYLPIDSLVRMIKAAKGVEGISILGGEPFAQAEACLMLCRAIEGLSVMVFSGYTLNDLENTKDPFVYYFLKEIDLLVDGPYLADQPEKTRRWVGSSNQEMHFLTERYSSLDPQFTSANSVEIRLTGKELLINGWPQEAKSLLKV